MYSLLSHCLRYRTYGARFGVTWLSTKISSLRDWEKNEEKYLARNKSRTLLGIIVDLQLSSPNFFCIIVGNGY